MIMHLQDLNLSKDEKERVAELHQTYGFIVYNAGFSMTMEEGRKVEMCYWRCLRGVRESALFPTHEAAWRDALRVHDEAVDAVKASPGVTRVKSMPADVAKEHSRLKRLATDQGYEFRERRGEHVWIYNGLTETGHNSHADAIKGAIRHWARRDPESFCNSMNILGSGGSETEITPLTSEELAKLQGMPGYKEMPEEHQVLTVQSQQLLKHLAQRGIKIDMSAIEPGTLVEAASVSYKSQGKTFEEARRASQPTRAYGVVTGSEEEGKLRTLECAGYQFFFTSSWGWKCEAVPKATGALVTAINAAWTHAIQNGGNEEDMLATARAYQIDGEKAAVGVKPEQGKTYWVHPHNLCWGFNTIAPVLAKVLAFRDEFVWLEILSDIGETVYIFTTTRTDKADFHLWKGNQDA